MFAALSVALEAVVLDLVVTAIAADGAILLDLVVTAVAADGTTLLDLAVAAIAADFAIPLDETMSTVAADLTLSALRDCNQGCDWVVCECDDVARRTSFAWPLQTTSPFFLYY